MAASTGAKFHVHADYSVRVLLTATPEARFVYKAVLTADSGYVIEAWGDTPREAIDAAFNSIGK